MYPTPRQPPARMIPTVLQKLLCALCVLCGAQSAQSQVVTTVVQIGQPFGVEVGRDGKLYVTEIENHRVLCVDLAAKKVTTVAGSGRRGYSGDGGPATEATLDEPYEVRFDRRGNVFFVEMKNHLIRRVDARSGVISTIAGTGKPGFGGDGGPARNAMFNQPHSIALDGERYLYVADIGNHRIRRIDLARGTIDSIAGNGEKKLPDDGQPVKDRPLLGPRALAFDRGTLWIALREGHSIWSLDLASGRIRHVAGTGRRGYSGDGGPAKQATFDGPKGIAVGPGGHIYVVDSENQAIRRIARAGTITTVAGGGPNRRGYSGDGGPPRSAQFDRPHGIAVAPDGAIYIGDTNNHRVRRIGPQ
jgi:DNA-binding beta-propeller fold protein YncE